MSLFSRPLTIPATLPPAARPASGRWIDPRAQRFAAATSGVTLLVAAALDAWPIVTLTAALLAVSAALGTRWFLFARPWTMVRTALRLAPSELEHELPPRFAQALGATFLVFGGGMLAAGLAPWGWLPVLAVIGLQALLAVTGFCLGCRLFFLRWWVPDLFARLVGRGIRREALVYVDARTGATRRGQ
jgi:hypothetical protein